MCVTYLQDKCSKSTLSTREFYFQTEHGDGKEIHNALVTIPKESNPKVIPGEKRGDFHKLFFMKA